MKKNLLVTFSLLLVIFSSCKKNDNSPTQPNSNITELEGTWTEIGTTGITWTFTNNAFDIHILSDSVWEKGTFSLNTSVNPKQIDFTMTELPDSQYIGKVALGIYKLESGILTIAVNALGKTTRPSGFSADSNGIITLSRQATQTPGVSVLSTPANNTTGVSASPTLTWNASSGAMGYTLQVSTGSSFSSYVYNQNGLTNTNVQITGLSNSTQYYWRVSATNNYGTSGWSTVWNFATAGGNTYGTPCPGVPTVTYSGKTYHTVQIGSQCWLKENLDVGTMIHGSDTAKNNGIIEKYCQYDDPANCTTYGGLYQWNEAMQYVTTSGTQGICPTSWHIPTIAEYQTLDTIVSNDGNSLKAVGQDSTSSNTSGFSALLAGVRNIYGSFGLLGFNNYFWSSSKLGAGGAQDMSLNNIESIINFYGSYTDEGYSVRCIKN
jgi:uncharacterized protein (TIGR02145 family)/uncharacterized protein (TIGR03067 family)